MNKAQVITVSDHDGWTRYYIVPAEEADDIVDLHDVYEKEAELDSIITFHDPISFAEWYDDTEIELTSYWETREI
jgi:hypothetical protein